MLFDPAQRAEFDSLQSLPEFKALKEKTEDTIEKLRKVSQRIADSDSAFDEWYWSRWDAKHPNARAGNKTRIESDGTWDEPVVQVEFERLKLKQERANKTMARCKQGFFQQLRAGSAAQVSAWRTVESVPSRAARVDWQKVDDPRPRPERASSTR